ncbi:MAG TPA: class I SAM-dependent methyltransferase [Verrucomicrobiae bacterium]|nr:class I SAM-dependent methyltransferase [Verrucomicrobiae bacterium]
MRPAVAGIIGLDIGFALRLLTCNMSVGESRPKTETPSHPDAYYPTADLTYQSKINDPYSSHSVILRIVGEGKGKRLLDVGSAQGVLAQKFTERGFEVTCIEGSEQLAALGRDKCQRMIVADLDKPLPPLDGTFDVIVYGDILEHLRNPQEVFTGFNRSLRPDGRVIVSVPNIAHLWVRLRVLFGGFPYGDRGILDRTHLRFFTLSTFRGFLSDAGMEWDEIVSTPVPLLLVVPPRHHGQWLRTLQALNAMLARCWKTMFGYQFVAVVHPRRTS